MPRFIVIATGTNMGEYRAQTVDDALNQYAKEAGHTDYQEVCDQFGDTCIAHEIDICKLILDAEEKTGEIAMQDAYGGGVLFLHNKSFATYTEVAEYIGRNIADYYK